MMRAEVEVREARAPYYWRKMPIAALNQDPPVLNTWYTVLDTTEDARVIFIALRRLDDDAIAKRIAIRVTVDGVVMTTTLGTINDNQWNYIFLNAALDGWRKSIPVINAANYDDFRGQEVLIETRQYTDAIGANAELDGRVQYEVWRPT